MDDLPQQDVYGEDPRADVAPYIPVAARSALDIGCGKGGFGITLRRVLGPDARLVGIDAHPGQAETARTGHGFDEVLTGYFPAALDGREERFDAVFLNDVLEHVLDPWKVLEQVHDVLSPGGTVVAAIPSIQYAPVLTELLKGRWDYADTGTLDRTHVRFFTRATMIEMFEGAGFRVISCAGATSAWTAHWWQRTWKRRLLLKRLPDSEWMHFVIVGVSSRPQGRAVPPGPPTPA